MKCYAVFNNGREMDIDKGTYEELTKRINTGRTKGWYLIKHGPSMGSTINIEGLSSVEMVLTEKERKAKEKQAEDALNARIAKVQNKTTTGRRAEGQFTYEIDACPVNHGKIGLDREPNIEVRYYMSDQDVKHYVPHCTMCGWVGQLIKPASVNNTFGVELKDVEPLYKED